MVGSRNFDLRGEMARITDSHQLRLKVLLHRPDAGAGKRASASSSPPTPPSTPTDAATAGLTWTLSFGSPTSPPPTTSVSTALRVRCARAVWNSSAADGVLPARYLSDKLVSSE